MAVLGTVMVSGGCMMGKAIPSFLSKRTSVEEQGGVLIVTQPVSSTARIPGPLVGGSVCEVAGLATRFLRGAALSTIATLSGVRINFEGQASR